MVTLISNSPEETQALGAEWASQLAPGWVIGLSGDLGAGKTQLVKGLASGLGYPGRVHSPTFALINIYEGGRLVLHHIDLYRLDGPEAVWSAGLEEYLHEPVGLTVVEWVDRWLGEEPLHAGPDIQVRLPKRYRHVVLEPMEETRRRIVYEDHCP